MYGRIQMSSTASIFPELADTTPVLARVILIDKLLDSASNTFRVTLRLPNPGNALPAGLRCRADFGLEIPTNGAPRATGGKVDANAPANKPVPSAGTARPR
jgi:hypothetical protein